MILESNKFGSGQRKNLSFSAQIGLWNSLLQYITKAKTLWGQK